MSAKIPVFVICVEAIIYLLLYNFYDCTFNIETAEVTYKTKNSEQDLINIYSFWKKEFEIFHFTVELLYTLL